MTYEEFRKQYNYDVRTDRLGAGGFGSVFKAWDNIRDRSVALKIAEVKPGYENRRLKNEVELIRKLPVHPNIAYYEGECHTFDSPTGEVDYAIMQYYEEGDLSKLLKANALTSAQKTSVLTQILNGLDFLHAEGIIHRDLKPQNILIAKRRGEYIPKITDFGISKKDVDSTFSDSLRGAGSLPYCSPEQIRGMAKNKNTDLWSFGVIVFQMFAGRRPFDYGTHSSTSEAGRSEMIRQIDMGRLPDAITEVPEPWQTLVRRCLVGDPEKRVKNAAECLDILSGKYADTEADTPEPAPQDDQEVTVSPPEDDETVLEIPAEKDVDIDRSAPPAASINEETPVPVSTNGRNDTVTSPPPSGGKKSNRDKYIVFGVFGLLLAVILFVVFKPNKTAISMTDTPEAIVDSTTVSAVKNENATNAATPSTKQSASPTTPVLQPSMNNTAEEQRRREAEDAEKKRRAEAEAEKKRQAEAQEKLRTAKTNAEAAFAAMQWDTALEHWKTIKSLDPDDNTGYNRFLNKAKELAAFIGTYDNASIKDMLRRAKTLRNTTEVNKLLAQ